MLDLKGGLGVNRGLLTVLKIDWYGMAFIGFLKNILTSGDSSAKTSAEIQRRQHQRFDINDPSLCSLEHERLGLLKISNISHFGCFVLSDKTELFQSLSFPFDGCLKLVGRKHKVQVTKADKRSGGFGLTIRHGDVDSLQRMGSLIAPLRWGWSAIHVGDEQSATPRILRSKYRGEGPFDLVVEHDGQGHLSFLMATFLLPSGDYACVVWEGGRLLTKKTIDQSGVSARMSQTSDVDLELVATCATACLAMKQPMGATCAKMLYSNMS